MDKKVRNITVETAERIFADSENLSSELIVNLYKLLTDLNGGIQMKEEMIIMGKGLMKAIDSFGLDAEETFVIGKHYGLDELAARFGLDAGCFKGNTVKEISLQYEISESAILRILESALKKLESLTYMYDVRVIKGEEKLKLLNLTTRTYNALFRSDIRTLEKFLNLEYKDLERIRNLGKKGIEEILNVRAKMNKPLEEKPKEFNPFIGDENELVTLEDDIYYLNIAGYIRASLREAGIETIRDFLKLTSAEILKIEGIGPKTLEELEKISKIIRNQSIPERKVKKEVKKEVSVEEYKKAFRKKLYEKEGFLWCSNFFY